MIFPRSEEWRYFDKIAGLVKRFLAKFFFWDLNFLRRALSIFVFLNIGFV